MILHSLVQRVYDLARILKLGIISKSVYKNVTATVTSSAVDSLHQKTMEKTRNYVKSKNESDSNGVRRTNLIL